MKTKQLSDAYWQPRKFVPCIECQAESLTDAQQICLDCWLEELGAEIAGIEGSGYEAEVTPCDCGRMTIKVRGVTYG